ncbi:hypothetical protein [Sphingomonas montanisoli]|uniref:Uncharacterized protein n=1 Tax=Sphingomonas montanisoli TaxID=2606412 RepID=A0A5D9BXW9_9SPHN|nr:hypothetical protein [Sphingomonas montanisoli]TZG24113.1 hypothetical protein FYJ91_19965 [Sphingomonas montanisoli]
MKYVHYILYHLESGALLQCGGPVLESEVARQAPPDRPWGAVAVDEDALIVEEDEAGVPRASINMVAVRRSSIDRINAGAVAELARHLTPGMAGTYAAKLAEAEALSADPDAAAPMLRAEADASGQSLADVAAAVIQRAQECQQIRAAIEAARQQAKAAALAGNIPAMVAAEQVDWAAVSAAALEGEEA